MKKCLKYVSLILLILFIIQCTAQVKQEIQSIDAEKNFGQIVAIDIKNGIWGIVNDTGDRLLPVGGLPQGFQIEGLRVYVDYELIDNGENINSWTPIRLIKIMIE